jgi:hypothetical protein
MTCGEEKAIIEHLRHLITYDLSIEFHRRSFCSGLHEAFSRLWPIKPQLNLMQCGQ